MTADWQSRIDAAVDESMERMVALRRHFHAHPEPSGEELQTSLHLYRLFDEMGLTVRMGPEGCGVIVESRNPNAGTANRACGPISTRCESRIRSRRPIAARCRP